MAADWYEDAQCERCGRELADGRFFCRRCLQLRGAAVGVGPADYNARAVALVIDWGLTVVVTAISIGAVIAAVLLSGGLWLLLIPFAVIWLAYGYWWFIALRESQTPGKRIMGIWVAAYDGEPAGLGLMLARELVVKVVVFGWLASVTAYIALFADLVWPFWDRNFQTLHDKIAGTHVVRGPRSRARTTPPS